VRGASEEVIAVLCSDLHLSHKPPVARSAEENWYGAMKRYLKQLDRLAGPDMLLPQKPVIVAGDVFDRWNPPPELINFAIRHMPKVYAVPGQHDLPNHRYEDIRKSGYWTLVEAQVITNLPPDVPVDVPGRTPIRLQGFPWGFPPCPLEDPCDIAVEVAVVHDYLWMKGAGYDGAPDDKRLKNRKGQFAGYDVAVVGDNHVPFDVTASGCRVINCGGFMRRKADERKHKPSVGLLYADGSVKRHYLETDEDKWLDGEELIRKAEGRDYREFVDELLSLGEQAVDFSGAIERLIKSGGVPDSVAYVIRRAMEEK